MNMYRVKMQSKEEIEAEEILFDSEKKKREEFQGRLELKIEKTVLETVFFLSLLFLFGLFLRCLHLVFAQGEYFQLQAKENYLRLYFTEAPRGLILSSEGEILVENIKKVGNIKENGREIKKTVFKRRYRNPLVFSSVLGYIRETEKEDIKNDPYYQLGDQIGRAGLEKEYERYFRGEKGEIEKVITTRGRFLEKFTKETSPKQGNNLILSINAALQEKLYQAILEKVPGKKGASIILNPQNGKILALLSFPSDDTNIYLKDKISKEELELLQKENKIFNINRALEGLYPFGSTIKPLIAAAALEEGIINKKTTINCQGKIVIPNPWNPDFPTIKKDWKAHGITDLNKAIAESCNVFFYSIGGGWQDIEGLGIERIKKYLDLFYIENNLGIDLPEKKPGFIPTPEWFKNERKTIEKRDWSIADVYDLSIGQGFFRASPLHLAVALSTFLNGGKIYEPHLVDRIEDQNGNLIRKIESKILVEGFIKKENLEAVKKAMGECVASASGSCRALQDLPATSGGKTGTAETGKKDEYHSWFVGFAPFEDPEILILVLIENGEGGEKSALPIAKEVLDWYFGQK